MEPVFDSCPAASLRDTINESHLTLLYDESDSAMESDKEDTFRGFSNNGFRTDIHAIGQINFAMSTPQCYELILLEN